MSIERPVLLQWVATAVIILTMVILAFTIVEVVLKVERDTNRIVHQVQLAQDASETRLQIVVCVLGTDFSHPAIQDCITRYGGDITP